MRLESTDIADDDATLRYDTRRRRDAVTPYVA